MYSCIQYFLTALNNQWKGDLHTLSAAVISAVMYLIHLVFCCLPRSRYWTNDGCSIIARRKSIKTKQHNTATLVISQYQIVLVFVFPHGFANHFYTYRRGEWRIKNVNFINMRFCSLRRGRGSRIPWWWQHCSPLINQRKTRGQIQILRPMLKNNSFHNKSCER